MGSLEGSIKAGLPEGRTPMDVINAIVAKDNPPEPKLDPQAIADEIRNKREEERKDAEPVSQPSNEPQRAAEPIIPDIEPTTPREESTSDNSKEENFKKIRLTLKEKSEALKAKEEELEKVRKENEDYKTGKVIPDYVHSDKTELERLRHFEKLHSLKTSKEYNEKFIKPITDIKQKLYGLGKEYEIPEEVLDQAIGITDRRELNRFLENHFETLDAIKAKDLIDNVKEYTTKAREAELEPAKLLKDLEQEGAQIEAQRKSHLKSVLNERQNKAWSNSLATIRAEGKATELIPRSDDTEFNNTYVEPILKAAGTEFAKIVAKIESKLAEPLDEEEMYYLARMTQLAHASAVSMETRNRALTAADTLLKNTQRTNKYERPRIGGQDAPGTGANAPVRETRDDRISALLEKGTAGRVK